jgi:hypothetical protein
MGPAYQGANAPRSPYLLLERAMAEYKDREHYIPLRKSELVELLVKTPGMSADDVQQFRRLAELLTATFHFEYNRLLEQLKDMYAPFDPDAVTKQVIALSDEERRRRLDELYKNFVFLMERANFTRLPMDKIIEAIKGKSDWGLPMDVDFKLFDRLEIFVRGEGIGDRVKRRWYRFWKVEQVKLPLYERLVVFAKLHPSKRLPREVDTADVFLKIFKDIPKLDVEMLLPGARLKMPGFQRLKLGSSLVGSGAMVGYGVFNQLLLSSFSFFTPFLALFGYGYRQYYGYQSTRNLFHLRLTQSLYYQTLGNNLGVIFHLLDEAEEQECREALLAYFHLWRQPRSEGWRATDLDDYIEMDLERIADLKVDFEVDDALAKLARLKLVTMSGDRYVAVPIAKALEALDYAWDNYFSYNRA